jgi:hypothetical protein
VIDDTKKYIDLFTGEDIVPKFELLKAFARGRYEGFKAYEESLNYVALTYPQSEEGKKAEQIVKQSLPALKNTTFTENENEAVFYLVYPFEVGQEEMALELQQKLDAAIADKGYENQFYTSVDFYTPQQFFVIVHGLQSKLGAEGFGKILEKEEDYQIGHTNFSISDSNYQIIQVHKNLDAYLTKQSQ